MKFLRYLLPFVVVTVSGAVLHAGTDDPGAFSTVQEERERDPEAIDDYLKTKRSISIAEKGGNLSLSGEVRAEWDHMGVKTHGHLQRGYSSKKLYPNSALKKAAKAYLENNGGSYKKLNYTQKAAYRAILTKLNPPYGRNEFTVQAAMILDYVAERGWASIKLQFENPAGLTSIDRTALINDSKNIMYGSGKSSNVSLRKAFAGYNIWDNGTSRFDIELGRRKLYDVFDSRIQFYSQFDGILAKFTTSFDSVADVGVKLAGLVVDSTVNHYAWVGELDFLNLGDVGLDLKYSYIHWDFHHKNRFNHYHPRGTQFNNSQITAAYNYTPDFLQKKSQVYAAYLVNHAARANKWTDHKKANDAFYVGFTLGGVVKKNDWAFDLNYQWVEAQAVSDRDLSGIARDNPRNFSFYNRRCGGFANYKGYKGDFFYAITDNWTVNASFERVHQVSKRIGGRHKSYQTTLASIFAF